jgi:hypothetical protein
MSLGDCIGTWLTYLSLPDSVLQRRCQYDIETMQQSTTNRGWLKRMWEIWSGVKCLLYRNMSATAWHIQCLTRTYLNMYWLLNTFAPRLRPPHIAVYPPSTVIIAPVM